MICNPEDILKNLRVNKLLTVFKNLLNYELQYGRRINIKIVKQYILYGI